MTISAGLEVNNDEGISGPYLGVGLGFYSSSVPVNDASASAIPYFSGVVLNPTLNSLTLSQGAADGTRTTFVSVPWPSATLGTLPSTTIYSVSYSIDTAASNGGISNVTVTNTTTGVSDSADFAAIDSYNGANLFTDGNTAYAAFMNVGDNLNDTALASNFQLSTTIGLQLPTWIGANSTTWTDAGNWINGVPGTTSGTTNTDTAIFNGSPPHIEPIVDLGRNLQNITFTSPNVGAVTLGTTTGNPLLLTSGGRIQTNFDVINPEVVNAPLVLEGNYSFISGANSGSATLSFGGAITPGPTSGTTTLTLDGVNVGANTISGVLADHGAGKLALTVNGAVWTLGAVDTYSGPTTVAGGTLRIQNGDSLSNSASISISAGSMNIAGSVSNPSSISITGGSVALVAGGSIGGTPGITISSGSMNVAGSVTGPSSINLSGGSLSVVTGGSIGGSPSIAISSGLMTVAGPVASSSSIGITGGSLVLTAGGSIGGSPAITISNGSLSVASSASLGSSSISLSNGGVLTAVSGATVAGNPTIGVTGTGSLALQPGSGSLAIGSNSSGTAGATLSLTSGGAFSMVDGAIGTVNLQQQSGFGAGNTALTLNGASLSFDFGSVGADSLAVNVGKAAVSGVNNIGLNLLLGTTSLTVGASYPLISAPSGLNSGGSFVLNNPYVAAGTNIYKLALNNSSTAESLTVSAPSYTIISDTFQSSSVVPYTSHAPDINIPGGSYVYNGNYGVWGPFSNVQTNGTGSIGPELAAGLPIHTAGNYVKPTMMTISAGLQTNTLEWTDNDPWRGIGLGFFPEMSTNTSNIISGEQSFVGVVLSPTGTLMLVEGNSANVYPGNKEVFESVGWSGIGGAAFSPTTTYQLTYTINTATGGISGVSLSGSNADFSPIDNDRDALFINALTNYAGFVGVSSAGFADPPTNSIGEVGLISNFQLSAVAPSAWTGAADNTWANPGNWTGAVPGSTSGTTNTDLAVFNQPANNSPTSIDIGGRNIQGILFDLSVNSLTVGDPNGPALLLSSGGTIQTMPVVANPELVSAPLVLEGNYTFTSGATATTATLSFNGNIAPAATSGTTTLTLNGSNTGLNTISGALADNGAGKLAVAVGGTGLWVYSGTAKTYSGGTSIGAGATLELAGSASQLSQTMNVANAGSLLVAGSGNQNVGTVTGSGDTAVNSGSLTAYQIRQNSLTINGTSRVTLSPSGSGSTTAPAKPNNINFSSNVGTLSIGGTTDAWTGTLDIGNNGLVIQYGAGADPFATIENMVHSGYANGSWTGTGITSSVARAAVTLGSPTPALNIGLVDFIPNTPGYGSSISFEGQTITTSAVLVRLTYMDDLVLAGDMLQANATSDALFFAANYGSGTTWKVGDVTHDGHIDTNDALLFAANYVVGLPSLDGTTGNAAALGGNGAAVPEPSSIALGALGAVGLALISRCRRRKLKTEN